MGAFLHIPTLLVTAALGTFCLGITLGMVGRRAPSDQSMTFWSSGFLMATMALLLLALRGHIPDILSIHAANALLLLSYGFNWLGYRSFARLEGRLDLLVASLGMLSWIGYSFVPSLFDDINNRLFFLSITQVMYLVPTALVLRTLSRREKLPAIRMSQILLGGYAIVQTVRGIYALASPLPVAPGALPNNFYVSVSLITSALFCVFLGLLQLSLFAQRTERQFKIAAETDALTGLANRRRLHTSLMHKLASDSVHGALVIFDIDHFKAVNDSHGHLAGDRALVRFAEVLSNETPVGGMAARIGGEEFALFLPEANTTIAAAIADSIRRRARDLRIPVGQNELRLTVSCGVAGIREAGNEIEQLWEAADGALYRAKKDGRDRVSVYRWRPSTTQLTIAGNETDSGPAAIAV